MSSGCEEIAQRPIGKVSDFDFVRYTIADYNGIARSKVLTQHSLRSVGEKGPGCYMGTVAMGIDGTVVDLPEAIEQGFGDATMTPCTSTLHKVGWADAGEHRVGQVFCEPTLRGVPQATAPRVAAREMCDLLQKEFGLVLWHACEFEFQIWGAGGHGDCLFDSSYLISQTFGPFQRRLFDISKQLTDAGVPVETLELELGKSQFEITFEPEVGVVGADNAFLFKSAMKEVFRQEATFMSTPTYGEDGMGSSCHFNESLWKALPNGQRGESMMVDESGALSDTAQHWLAGQLAHASALTAFACPTVNDARRLTMFCVPKDESWGVDNRSVMIRVKLGKNPYLEMRLGGAAANPYLLLAGMVAAGIDGLRRKLPLPQEQKGLEPIPSAKKLPSSLKESLAALKADRELCELLSPDLIKWFCLLKEDEIKKIQEVQGSDAEVFQKEVDLYGVFI